MTDKSQTDTAAQAVAVRNATIEECAKVAEMNFGLMYTATRNKEVAKTVAGQIAKCIRALASQPPAAPVDAEKQIRACMIALEDVPGETLTDRVNRLVDWYQALSNNYHKDVAEARECSSANAGLVKELREQAIYVTKDTPPDEKIMTLIRYLESLCKRAAAEIERLNDLPQGARK